MEEKNTESPGENAGNKVLFQMQGGGRQLEGWGGPWAAKPCQPAVRLGKAEVCGPSPDPPQESAALAIGEGVPQGKRTRTVICRIHAVLLRKVLPVRETPQKTGGFRPLATLLFILLISDTGGSNIGLVRDGIYLFISPNDSDTDGEGIHQ